MNVAAALREELRPHGSVAPGCKTCLHLGDCGGFEPEQTLFNNDCVQANCCRSHLTGDDATFPPCENVCPNNPAYLQQLREIGGLSFANTPSITQRQVLLPRYIPLTYRRYIQKVTVSWPMVALNTYEVVKVKHEMMKAVATCPATLRQTFGLANDTAVILRGVADDRPLERYWTYRRRDGVPQQLGVLGVTMAVGPNFSHFLDVPRHDNLFNRKRQLLCLREFVDAGVNTAPHLNAAQPGDWRFWTRYLAQNSTVTVIAVEFETGNRTPSEGKRAIGELVRLQQAVGRRLHPLLIGGTQFLERIALEFEAGSFIDSTPFMKTVYRQKFFAQSATCKAIWRPSPTLPGESLDKLLRHNLQCYSEWLEKRWASITGDIDKVPTQRLPLPIAPA